MIALYICLGILGAFLLFYVFPTLLVSNVIYTVLFVRTKKEKWARGLSWDDPEQQRMFDEGEAWGKENDKYRQTVSITSDKFKLVGEYFDFGNDKAVIVIAGRMEAGTYSYYFSDPYKKAGYNVLAIDNRSHGLSDGRYNTIGLKEYRDIIAWAKFLHVELGMKTIMIHGICIGSATGLYAVVSEECPDYVKGLVADGMYLDFHESLDAHLVERHKPKFPFTMEIMGFMTLVAGKSPKKHGPIKVIGKLKKPILFIYSKEDTYSTHGQLLYDTCNAPKHIEWFDHGVHSHVRINAPEKYDLTIKKFLEEYIHE